MSIQKGKIFKGLLPKDMEAEIKRLELDKLDSFELNYYQQCTPDLLKRLEEEPLLMFIHSDEFERLSFPLNQLPSNFSRRGRVVIRASDDFLAKIADFQHLRVEVIADNISDNLLRFKLKRELQILDNEAEAEKLMQQYSTDQNILTVLNEIGQSLSTERDLNKLLEMIVERCRQFTTADAGSLYLIEPDHEKEQNDNDWLASKQIRFQVAQNESRKVPFSSFVLDIGMESIYGRVAITQKPIVIDDVYKINEKAGYSWGGRKFDQTIGYRTKSMLTVPMVNFRGQTIGVIQLINRKTRPDIKLDNPDTALESVLPFTKKEEGLMMSVASQASISLQNAQLVNDIRNLFEGFINASTQAIESRDPTTSGHSYRVATLTVDLAKNISALNSHQQFSHINYSHEQLEEIRYAALLHDFGKIGVREHVLIKAKKLYPYEHQRLLDRFEYIRTLITLQHTQKQLEAIEKTSSASSDKLIKQTKKELQQSLEDLEKLHEFLEHCNEPIGVSEEDMKQLEKISQTSFISLSGKEMPVISKNELISLKVPRGSLTQQDREEIESHVTHTYRFLSKIPWTANLKSVPDIAHAHHEKLDGSGYPNQLNSSQIPPQSKMMTISDIFDALTALDRPYKKSIPVERALQILSEEANANHIDQDMLDVFIQKRVYELVIKDGKHLNANPE